MIDEADRDGDGEVNQQEFLRIMKKTSLYWMLSEAQEYVKYSFLCKHFQVVVFYDFDDLCTVPFQNLDACQPIGLSDPCGFAK